MAGEILVEARVSEDVKEQAAVVLAEMGLTIPDAVRLLLTRVAEDKALPFEPATPNAVTAAAIEEARRGGLRRLESVDALFADLDADD